MGLIFIHLYVEVKNVLYHNENFLFIAGMQCTPQSTNTTATDMKSVKVHARTCSKYS